jgi:hypothetical protein
MAASDKTIYRMVVRRVPVIFALMFTAATCSLAQTRDFPKGSLGPTPQQDEFKQAWYSSELRALQEPSLFASAENRNTECYRFLWLRTFHHPIAVRLNVRPDGSGVLSVKVASGTAGFSPGSLRENRTVAVNQQQVRAFQIQVDQVGFWRLGREVKSGGNDGSQWIIEAVKDGKYHLVDRWSPKTGAVRSLGLTLAMVVARMNIPKDEIY